MVRNKHRTAHVALSVLEGPLTRALGNFSDFDMRSVEQRSSMALIERRDGGNAMARKESLWRSHAHCRRPSNLRRVLA